MKLEGRESFLLLNVDLLSCPPFSPKYTLAYFNIKKGIFFESPCYRMCRAGWTSNHGSFSEKWL